MNINFPLRWGCTNLAPLMKRRRDSLNGKPSATWFSDSARMERVHMRQHQPSLWPVSFPIPSPPSPQTCPSPSLVQSSSPSISSPYSMVRPSPSVSHPVLTHLTRALPFPLWGVHQRPLQQATAKGRREPSPHPSLDNSFRPHNMGSYPRCR